MFWSWRILKREKKWGGVKDSVERWCKSKSGELREIRCQVKAEGGDIDVVYGRKDKYDGVLSG